jgi:glycosyltransferase involved in cell wall biosynthesis
MKICFIADTSSIHVKRIISYYINKRDDILVISTSPKISEIPNVKTKYLLFPYDYAQKKSFRQKEKRDFVLLLKAIIPKGMIVSIKRTIRNLFFLRKSTFCRREIQRFDPEVIYCFRSFPEGMLASYCHVKPLLLRTAGPDISKLPRYPIYRQVIRKALQTADVIVTESIWERKLLRNLCGAGVKPEVSVIGVDTTLFRPPCSRDSLRDKYDIPREAFVVVSNRYLEGHYRGWMVVQAFQSIMEHCSNLVLLYINPAPLGLRAKAKAEAIVARFPRIKFLEGPLPHAEMPGILGCGDIYISFSAFDGIPNSLLEAMACGLVPIVGELPQLHEWIEQGVTGYFVPQKDIKRLASVVRDLYQHRQALPEMSMRCMEKIRVQGSYEVCSQRTRDLLRRLAQESHRLDDSGAYR